MPRYCTGQAGWQGEVRLLADGRGSSASAPGLPAHCCSSAVAVQHLAGFCMNLICGMGLTVKGVHFVASACHMHHHELVGHRTVPWRAAFSHSPFLVHCNHEVRIGRDASLGRAGCEGSCHQAAESIWTAEQTFHSRPGPVQAATYKLSMRRPTTGLVWRFTMLPRC